MKVYFDHAAATALDPRVKKAMEPYLTTAYGNPGALYSLGNEAKQAVDQARKKIARILHCSNQEVIFTSGGTESDNLAILGVARAYKNVIARNEVTKQSHGSMGSPRSPKGSLAMTGFGHIITTKIEHHAVLEPCAYLEKKGFTVTYLPVDKNGLVNPQEVARALRPDTILVSIMYANNEIGTIEPIMEIVEVIRNFKSVIARSETTKQSQTSMGSPPATLRSRLKADGARDDNKQFPFFHTDACQAAAYCDLDTQKLGVDLMTINGGKIYGPKGVGVLYARQGVKIEPMIFGGGQENNLRSGTENVPGIIGLAEALEIAQSEKNKESTRLSGLRDYLIENILKSVPKSFLNGDARKRLPNNVNISILDLEGEALVLYLDEKGIMCSTGSACTSSNLEPSHVLLAIGHKPATAHGSLRLTLGRYSTKKEADYFLKVLLPIVKKLRGLSPVRIRY